MILISYDNQNIIKFLKSRENKQKIAENIIDKLNNNQREFRYQTPMLTTLFQICQKRERERERQNKSKQRNDIKKTSKLYQN